MMDDSQETPKSQRPFRIIDGRKWVLADDEPWNPQEAEEPELLRLMPPPRDLPLGVRIRLLFASGLGTGFGLFFGAFALAIVVGAVYVVGMETALPRRWEPAGKVTIDRIEDRKLEVNDVKYYRFYLKRTDADGKEMIVTLTGPLKGRKVGDEVALKCSGRHWRFLGDKTNHAVWMFIAFGSVFLIIGMCISGFSFVGGSRAIRLLRDGEVGQAMFLGMEKTGTRVNDRYVMKMNYRHMVDDEPYTFHVKTLAPERLDDGSAKIVFYDPLNPAKAILWEALPQGITLDELTGRFQGNMLASLPSMFLLGIIIAEIATLIAMFVAAI